MRLLSVLLLAACGAQAQGLETSLLEPIESPVFDEGLESDPLPAEEPAASVEAPGDEIDLELELGEPASTPLPEPAPVSEPTDTPVPSLTEQVQQVDHASDTVDALDWYLADKISIKEGKTPAGWECPPLELYKAEPWSHAPNATELYGDAHTDQVADEKAEKVKEEARKAGPEPSNLNLFPVPMQD